MKLTLTDSYIDKGKIYPAGEEIEIPDELAKRLKLKSQPKSKASKPEDEDPENIEDTDEK